MSISSALPFSKTGFFRNFLFDFCRLRNAHVNVNTKRVNSDCSMDLCREVFSKVSNSRGVIPLNAVLEYFDTLELYLGRNVLNLEERDFLVEFIIDSPQGGGINWLDFQQLTYKLLNKSIEQLVASGVANSLTDDTMGVTKFNKLLMGTPSSKQTSLIKQRIEKLESLVLTSKSNSIRDSLIECYQILNKHRNGNIERIKRNVDKQDIIITQLKRKTGVVGTKWYFKLRYVLPSAVILFILVSFIVL